MPSSGQQPKALSAGGCLPGGCGASRKGGAGCVGEAAAPGARHGVAPPAACPCRRPCSCWRRCCCLSRSSRCLLLLPGTRAGAAAGSAAAVRGRLTTWLPRLAQSAAARNRSAARPLAGGLRGEWRQTTAGDASSSQAAAERWGEPQAARGPAAASAGWRRPEGSSKQRLEACRHASAGPLLMQSWTPRPQQSWEPGLAPSLQRLWRRQAGRSGRCKALHPRQHLHRRAAAGWG